jgi:hypothetical protein
MAPSNNQSEAGYWKPDFTVHTEGNIDSVPGGKAVPRIDVTGYSDDRETDDEGRPVYGYMAADIAQELKDSMYRTLRVENLEGGKIIRVTYSVPEMPEGYAMLVDSTVNALFSFPSAGLELQRELDYAPEYKHRGEGWATRGEFEVLYTLKEEDYVAGFDGFKGVVIELTGIGIESKVSYLKNSNKFAFAQEDNYYYGSNISGISWNSIIKELREPHNISEGIVENIFIGF